MDAVYRIIAAHGRPGVWLVVERWNHTQRFEGTKAACRQWIKREAVKEIAHGLKEYHAQSKRLGIS